MSDTSTRIPRPTPHDELKQKSMELERKQEQFTATNQYAEYIGSVMAVEKKLLRSKEKLTKFKEPVLFLQRGNGQIELYHNVKDKVFVVPKLPAGIEKRIYLGRQWQVDIPYAGKTFRAYWAHEDWAYPHIWSRPNELNIDKDEAQRLGMPTNWILESANVNSEAMRDRERKVLSTLEKYQITANQANIQAWAKFILVVGGIAIAGIWAWNLFTGGDPAPAVQTAVGVATANNTIIL